MRRLATFTTVLCALSIHPAFAHDGHSTPAPQPTLTTTIDLTNPPRAEWDQSAKLTIHLVDTNGKSIPGVVRISDHAGRRIKLPMLLSRATAITPGDVGPFAYAHIDSWSLAPGAITVSVPREPLVLEAFQGINTRLARTEIDLSNRSDAELTIQLKLLSDSFETTWQTGNCHLHLQKMSAEEAERYACETAAADGYDRVYFSYLERHEADRQYISNTFTTSDLARFSARSGVKFGYGEEYRHNFERNSEGYGHVMFLDLTKLILPASLGEAITKVSNDDHGLRPGIEQARAQAATILWCHAARGTEDVPNWIAGLVDVQMLFDTGNIGSYGEALYPYLNIGLHVPLATGTDWFFRDLAMTCVQTTPNADSATWLNALRNGRSYITNGPMLELTVNDQPLGTTLDIAAGETVSVKARALVRTAFGALELIVNGDVVSTVESSELEDHFFAELTLKTSPTGSAWIAARVKPFTTNYDEPDTQQSGFNEYGKPYFAHTSPIYVRVDGRPIFNRNAAMLLLADITRARNTIATRGNFTDDAARTEFLALYEKAEKTLGAMLKESGIK